MKITLCNQKGGAGKTTLTMLLAMALSNAGKRVGIIDLDSQETSSQWLEQLQDEGIVKVTNSTQSENCDIILFDTPPKLGKELLEALKQSDLAVIVSSPSPADIWSSKETVEYISKNAPNIRKKLLFNKVEKGRKSSQNLAEISEILGIDPLQNKLPYYSAYQHAILDGWKALKSKDAQPVINTALEIVTS